jgi:transposase
MDEREQKALVIAATSKIERRGSETWIVPSQSCNGKYAVTVTAEGKACTCPDFELRQLPCKHVMAVQYVLFREQTTETKPDGTVSTTTTETKAVRVTYAQNWPAYNAAQTTEKEHFLRLLHQLVAKVETPEHKGAGRPRTPLSDMLFAAVYKVYSGMSGRRFMTDLRSARDQGLVGHAPAFNTIFDALRTEEVTDILHDLVEQTAAPLREIEQDFAVDSTGFGTSNFFRYYSMKYKHEQVGRAWVKTHVAVGVRTNVVTAVKISGMNEHDSPQFPELVEQTAKNFKMREVSADKAYSSRDNLEFVESKGAAPFIPFKSNANPVAKSGRKSEAWERLFHLFAMEKATFLASYHKRSNVESSFSSMKRVLSGNVRAKTPVAQGNEVLLKIVAHNIRMLIRAAHDLGITPMLEKFACANIPATVREW